ncbi:hypothetical protein YB2330_002963 [Saitoella coloradoensis]
MCTFDWDVGDFGEVFDTQSQASSAAPSRLPNTLYIWLKFELSAKPVLKMSMLAAAVEPSECEVHPAAGTAVPPPIDPTIPATTEESEPVQSSTPGDTSYNHANTSVQHEAEAALTDQVPSPGQLQRFDTFCHQQLSATVSDNWKAEEVEKRRAVLQHTINSHRTTRPSILQPYWSARTGLLTKKSDLDFPIQCPQDLLDNVDPRRCLEEIKEILGNLQGVSKVELLTQALFPKLSCLYEGAEVDLTCWNGGAVFTAEVLAQCNELQPTFGQALRLLKLWAKKRRFSNTQGGW